MSYTAEVFNIMIASPGDVASERAIVREVIYEWDAVHASTRKMVLLPMGWETHSSPEMGGGAQGIINRQVLDKCDLLVGVFWTRIGTQTENYVSGTVEEIERHVASGRPAMLYFSSQPAALDSVNMNQYEELKHFKESCKSRGLYESYDSLADFKEKFYRQLQIKVNEHPSFQVEGTEFSDMVRESETRLPQLAPESRIVLKEASSDPHGHILHVRHFGGTNIQTNGKNLIQSDERREVAKWEAALEELIAKGLLIARGQKGEVFEVSSLGYQVADMIEL